MIDFNNPHTVACNCASCSPEPGKYPIVGIIILGMVAIFSLVSLTT